jgi:hypothetical protein
MQSKETRKESIRQFKEQKPSVGIYAVRCPATGEVWVGGSRNLGATKNGCWFTLRNGSHREPSLQAAWSAQGEAAFEYEVLEELDEDVQPLVVDDLLKAGKSRWVAQLKAKPLL